MSQHMTKPTVRPVTSKDSDQPIHSPNMTRVLVHPSQDSLEAVEEACNQQRL